MGYLRLLRKFDRALRTRGLSAIVNLVGQSAVKRWANNVYRVANETTKNAQQ